MKVMVIDDSAIVLELARNALEGMGCTVVALDTPLGAAIIAHQEKPDLVLVDLAMASMSGEQVIKGLKARGKLPAGTRILLFSDRSEGELKTVATRCGADGWVRKSPDQAALLSAVRSASNQT